MKKHSNKLKDLELIDKMINGTLSERMLSQSRLYEKYEKTLSSYVSRIFYLDEFEVDSVVAIAFEKAFRKIHTYDNEYSFNTWLMKIAKNTAIDSFRGKKKIETISFTDFHNGSDESEARDYDPVDEDSVEGFNLQMESDYDTALIENMLLTLPLERDREIMRMKYIEDLTHREVGERLGVPMGTIQSIVNKSIKHLQSIADDYRDDREDNINEHYLK